FTFSNSALLSGRSLHVPQERLSKALLRLGLFPLPQHLIVAESLPQMRGAILDSPMPGSPKRRPHDPERTDGYRAPAVVVGRSCFASTNAGAARRSARYERGAGSRTKISPGSGPAHGVTSPWSQTSVASARTRE